VVKAGLAMGVDICAGGSPSALSQPKYSLAVVSEDGSVVYRREGVGLRSVVKQAWRYRPAILAVDNVYELADSRRKLLKLLELLPPEVRLVQVTGHPSQARPLIEVAASRGFEAPSKLTPLKTAVLCARLALMGEGCEVRLREPEVKITISRARSPGAGGMSHDRYKRDVRSQVLQATREICEALKSRGIEYDLFLKTSRHGLDRGVIIAYASRSQVQEVVRPYEGGGVKVRLQGPREVDVEFVPMDGPLPPLRQGRYLIVGIDPGMVTGVAMLDLCGRPLLIVSRRGVSRLSLSRAILSHGRPLIVASDVNPPPALIRKLCSSLNAVMFVPSDTLTVDEKRRLVSGFEEQYGVRVRDSHQRDALAAALKAFMHYRNKFEQVESHVRLMNVKVPVDEVKALVVKGVSVQEAVKRLAPPPASPPARTKSIGEGLRRELEALREKVAWQREYIDKLERERSRLYEQLKSLSSELERLKSSVEELRSEQSLKVRQSLEIKKLEAQLEGARSNLLRLQRRVEELEAELSSTLEKLVGVARGELRILKPINALTPSSVAEGVKQLNIRRGDLVLVKDAASGTAEAVEMLAKLRVEAVVALTNINPEARLALIKHQLCFLEAPSLNLTWAREVALAPSAELEAMLSRARQMVDEESRKLVKDLLIDALMKHRLMRSRG